MKVVSHRVHTVCLTLVSIFKAAQWRSRSALIVVRKASFFAAQTSCDTRHARSVASRRCRRSWAAGKIRLAEPIPVGTVATDLLLSGSIKQDGHADDDQCCCGCCGLVALYPVAEAFEFGVDS